MTAVLLGQGLLLREVQSSCGCVTCNRAAACCEWLAECVPLLAAFDDACVDSAAALAQLQEPVFVPIGGCVLVCLRAVLSLEDVGLSSVTCLNTGLKSVQYYPSRAGQAIFSQHQHTLRAAQCVAGNPQWMRMCWGSQAACAIAWLHVYACACATFKKPRTAVGSGQPLLLLCTTPKTQCPLTPCRQTHCRINVHAHTPRHIVQ